MISDTDSTDDLGSSSIFWANTYTDTITFGTDLLFHGKTAGQITGRCGDSTDEFYFKDSGSNLTFESSQPEMILQTRSGLERIYMLANKIELNPGVGGHVEVSSFRDLRPAGDSGQDLGSSTKFWDETFTDELVLHNDGAASAASDTIRLSAKDLSAGNTMISVNTEGTSSLGTGTPTQDRTIAIDYNGTTYYILASTSAS